MADMVADKKKLADMELDMVADKVAKKIDINIGMDIQ